MVALSGGMGVFCKTDYLLFLQLLKTANRLLLMRDPPGVFQLPSVRILVLDYLGHSSYGSSLYLPERKCIWGGKKKKQQSRDASLRVQPACRQSLGSFTAAHHALCSSVVYFLSLVPFSLLCDRVCCAADVNLAAVVPEGCSHQ